MKTHNRNTSIPDELFPAGAHIAIAISGGLDSVCLFHMLHQTRAYNLYLLHVNYGLRGQESDLDRDFVVQLGLKESVPCYTLDAHALLSKGSGVQEKARKIRYQWFEEMIKKLGLFGVCTAHHTNDTAETILHNLIRKTGIRGLIGIQHRPPFYRPLLHFTKRDLLSYAAQHQLDFREDASNASNDYTRNQIRNHVLPVLNQINSRASIHIAQSAQQINQDLNFFEQLAVSWKSNLLQVNERGISWLNFNDLSAFQEPETALYYCFNSWGISRIQSAEMAESMRAKRSGSVWQCAHVTICATANSFFIIPKKLLQKPYTHKFSVQLSMPYHHPFFDMHWLRVDPKDSGQAAGRLPLNTMWVDPKMLDNEWELRNWRQGDKIKTQAGTQKVSDLFGEKRVPVVLREVWPVILLNNKIVWVPGLALDLSLKFYTDEPTLMIQIIGLYSPNP